MQRTLTIDWKVIICHCFHEANQCVNRLATFSLSHELGLRIHHKPPKEDLHLILKVDVCGVPTPHVVTRQFIFSCWASPLTITKKEKVG